jgi:hypothetical protein
MARNPNVYGRPGSVKVMRSRLMNRCGNRRCGNEWETPGPVPPDRCPACDSRRWQTLHDGAKPRKNVHRARRSGGQPPSEVA